MIFIFINVKLPIAKTIGENRIQNTKNLAYQFQRKGQVFHFDICIYNTGKSEDRPPALLLMIRMQLPTIVFID